ncbi:MAG: YdcF family protein [Parafilimonas terrae]|nr:YdcF family protein [Parafilimonas terrae]
MRRPRVLSGLALLVATGLAVSFVAFVFQIDSAEVPPRRHADGAVALTGGADRIQDAVGLLAQGSADRLLITGVNPQTTRGELVRQQPQARALFDCCIELGYEAENTIGNAAETERWVRAHAIRSLIVVTSNYHMPRAMAEIASVLPDVELQAYSVVSEHSRGQPWWSDGTTTRLVISEYVKYIISHMRFLAASAGADLRPKPPRSVLTAPSEEILAKSQKSVTR